MNFADNIYFVDRTKPPQNFQTLKNEFMLKIQGQKLTPYPNPKPKQRPVKVQKRRLN